MLRVFNDTAILVDEGGGKRKGTFPIYLEPWHADILTRRTMEKSNSEHEICFTDCGFVTCSWSV